MDALSIMVYCAVTLLGSTLIAKLLESLARNVLIPKHRTMDGINPFPWQRSGLGNKKKSNVIIPVVIAPEEKMEEGPTTPKKPRLDAEDGDDERRDFDNSEQLGDESNAPRESKQLWNTFAPEGPRQEYWEKCDELVDAQQRVTKMLHAARLRKLQEYTDFVLPSVEVDMLMAINKHELEHFGRQLLITEKKDSKLLIKSDTIKRARFAFFEAKPEKIIVKVEKARLLSEGIKNELDYMRTDEEKDAYLMRCFALNNLKGFRKRIAERYVLGEGRFESRRDVLRNKVLRMVSLALLIVLWALLVVFVQQRNKVIGTRASNLWLIITLVSIFQDMLIFQPLKIWARFCLVTSFVSSDIRQIFDALTSRFVYIIQRRAGAMRDANSLVQHLNPACRAARSYPQLPISRLLLAMNDYDVPHFHVDAAPLQQRRGADYWIGVLYEALNLFMSGVTQFPAPVQDAIYEFLMCFLGQSIVLLLVAAGTASAVLALLLGLSLPGALWVREWWKSLLKRRVVRKREAKAQEEVKLITSLRINTSVGLASDGTGLKQRNSPVKVTAASAMERTGRDAYLADDDLSQGVDDTVVFNSKFKPLRADSQLVQNWTAYGNLTSLVESAKKKKIKDSMGIDTSQPPPGLPAALASSPTKKRGGDGGPKSPVKSPTKGKRGTNPASKPETTEDNVDALPGARDTKGEGGSPENRREEQASSSFVLPTMMRYGGAGNFGGVREKGPDLLPSSPDRIAQSLEQLERSITANLESVIREAVDKSKDSTMRDMRREAAARRKARRAAEDIGEATEAGGGDGTAGPETGSPPDADMERRKSRRRRKSKATAEEVVAAAGPGTARRLVELVVERGLDLGNGMQLALAPASPIRGLRPGTAAARLDPSTPFSSENNNQSPRVGPGSGNMGGYLQLERPSTAPIESSNFGPAGNLQTGATDDYKHRPENKKALNGSKPGWDGLNLGSPLKVPREKLHGATSTHFPAWH